MRIVQRLILVIGLALIVSCAIPTTPEFPPVKCDNVQLSEVQLKELSTCKAGLVCTIKYTTLKTIFDIVQKKSECIEQYKAGASKFKG